MSLGRICYLSTQFNVRLCCSVVTFRSCINTTSTSARLPLRLSVYLLTLHFQCIGSSKAVMNLMVSVLCWRHRLQVPQVEKNTCICSTSSHSVYGRSLEILTRLCFIVWIFLLFPLLHCILVFKLQQTNEEYHGLFLFQG